MTTLPNDLDARFRAAAADEGLLDVAYDLTDSPVGTLLLASTDRGLCRISFDPEPDRALDELARQHGTRVLRSPKPLDETRRELDDYFEGRRRKFDLDVDLTAVTDFHRAGAARAGARPVRGDRDVRWARGRRSASRSRPARSAAR